MKKFYMLLIMSITVLGFTVSAHAISITNGLVAYYALDGNANDGSGNTNHGTEHGGLSYVAGVHGQAVSLDGVDDYISVADDNSLDLTTTGTLAGWVKLQAGSQYNSIISKMTGSSQNQVSYELTFEANSDTVTGYAHDGTNNTSAQSFTDIVDATWHHIAFTWDGGNGNLYMDGILDNDQTASATGAMLSSYDVLLGQHIHWNGTHYLNGYLDDVAIYDRALSGSEIQQLAEPVPEPTTVALLGIGLAGLAGAEVRRRRKKRAVDKS